MNLSDPRFVDPTAAREWLEAQRWPSGPVCPHCGNADGARITGMKGKAHRPGLYQCAECRDQFTVTVGSVMERSKIPLNKWVLAMHLMSSSKKGISAHQLHRMLGITYQSAWFLAHRIREAMRVDVADTGPLGGEGKIVEADETYYGEVKPSAKLPKAPAPTRGKHRPSRKRPIISLVERGGSVRSFYTGAVGKDIVTKIVKENIAKESRLRTDESKLYGNATGYFAEHLTVKHSAGEYVRYVKGDSPIHTNTIEGYFSIFKRGMKGIYQHCSEKHLHRYLAEFDFRYSNRVAIGIGDIERTSRIAKGAAGKRLTYRRPDEARV